MEPAAVKKIGGEIRDGRGVSGKKGVTTQEGISFQVLELLREAVHFPLERCWVIHLTNIGIPLVYRLSVGRAHLFPLVRIFGGKRIYEFMGISSHSQFWVHGREEEEMLAHFDALRDLTLLVLDRPVGPQEYKDVESDEGERDDRPASSRHALVAEGNEQHGLSFPLIDSRTIPGGNKSKGCPQKRMENKNVLTE